jgi:NTP pyrophosphatase (non-canonical NTP hydrolase)
MSFSYPVRFLMLPLQQVSALDDLQRYVAKMEEERGFAHRDVVSQCLLLGEEVGELFKAVRKHEKMRVGTTSVTGSVDEELADVLIYLCAIANRLGISLDEALRKKEEINETRTWK